jgi:hypothetical protein
MSCNAIIECAKRAVTSDQKENLVTFFENKAYDVLCCHGIPSTSEMYNWKGKDWIKNINEKNPIILDVLLYDFEADLNYEFTEYAIYYDFIAGHQIYELCGVYWKYELEDGQIDGPTTDKEEIYGLF